MVFEDEAEIGLAYPLHKWFAIGELNAAEKEIRVEYPLLAQITRQHRIAYQVDCIPVPSAELISFANELEDSETKDENNNSEVINNSEGTKE